MITDPIPADEIRFNPATSSYEARVTVHGAGPARIYACTVNAALTMSMDEAEEALRAEALERHVHRPGLYASAKGSELSPPRTTSNRDAAPAGWRARFERLGGLRAA